jgi:hypothetical protein
LGNLTPYLTYEVHFVNNSKKIEEAYKMSSL